jgi:hypothetical protein
MGANRKADEALVDHLYTWQGSADGVCAYCGDVASTVDHVFPLSQAAALSSVLTPTELRAKLRGGLSLVPACGDCNSRAGAKPFYTVASKRAYIQSKLRIKYRKLLDSPEWSEAELSELGFALRQSVMNDLQFKKRIRARIAWPNAPQKDD